MMKRTQLPEVLAQLLHQQPALSSAVKGDFFLTLASDLLFSAERRLTQRRLRRETRRLICDRSRKQRGRPGGRGSSGERSDTGEGRHTELTSVGANEDPLSAVRRLMRTHTHQCVCVVLFQVIVCSVFVHWQGVNHGNC